MSGRSRADVANFSSLNRAECSVIVLIGDIHKPFAPSARFIFYLSSLSPTTKVGNTLWGESLDIQTQSKYVIQVRGEVLNQDSSLARFHLFQVPKR